MSSACGRRAVVTRRPKLPERRALQRLSLALGTRGGGPRPRRLSRFTTPRAVHGVPLADCRARSAGPRGVMEAA